MLLAAQTLDSGILVFLRETWLIAEVILGIGLMIFIHELGHFLAAKKTGVRVETFSLGFGPKIVGFRKGDTLYQISLIPLGGFVKMAGENPGENLTGADDEIPSKTPYQRMWIFSAGVLMNFLFAFITFPIIFATGVPFVSPEIGQVTPGGPAWKADLRKGDKILEINGNTVYEYHDIPLNIALSKGHASDILLERDGEVMTKRVTPRMNEQAGFFQIGVTGPTRFEVEVERSGPARRAGLLDGDRIVRIGGVSPDEWLDRGESAEGKPVEFVVMRQTPVGEETVTVRLEPEIEVDAESGRIGIQLRTNRVQGLRGLLADVPDGLREGDAVIALGEREIFSQKDYIEALETEPLLFKVSRPVAGRSAGQDGDGEPEGTARKTMTIEYESKWRDALAADLALGGFRESNFMIVTPGGSLWELGLRDGVIVHAVNGTETKTFDEIVAAINSSPDKNYALTVTRHGSTEREELTVTAKAAESPRWGFDFKPHILIRNLNVIEASKAGFNCAIYQIKTCYLTLSRILSRDVSAKNIGGIITISVATHSFAQLGLARLFFFLAILSINLGFINILPIPVLDGGHLMFLLIEKIKGSPVNEKVMGYSQIVGLVLILALLVYVTYNDILRLFN